MSSIISAIVGTYNRCESLRDTLKALRGQVLKAGLELEIVVVDNNSTDRTRRVVEEAARAPGWPIRYVFEPRQGISFARNRAFQEARGEFIVSTDDDVIPDASWAQMLVEAMEAERADIAGGKILPLWLKTPPAWMASERLRRHLWNALAMLDCGEHLLVSNAEHHNFPFGANMAFRRSALAGMDGFRPDLGTIAGNMGRGEDTEFISRLGDAGRKIIYVPMAVVQHKVPLQRMRLSYFRRWKYQSGYAKEQVFPWRGDRFPWWVIREGVEHGLKALIAYACLNRIIAIEQEFFFWGSLGQLRGMMEYRCRAAHKRNNENTS